MNASRSHSWFLKCSEAPSSDSSILVKMSAPPFFFFMGHNFSITPHLPRLLLSLLLSACRILHRLHWMSGLISGNYGVISVAIIGSVCSEKVMWDTTRDLLRRLIIGIYRCRCVFTMPPLCCEFRGIHTENSGEKKKEEAFHVRRDQHREVRPEWMCLDFSLSGSPSLIPINDWNSPYHILSNNPGFKRELFIENVSF